MWWIFEEKEAKKKALLTGEAPAPATEDASAPKPVPVPEGQLSIAKVCKDYKIHNI